MIAQRATITRAIAAGLQLDPASKHAGYVDALNCARWLPPQGADVLAYASGYLQGTEHRLLKFQQLPPQARKNAGAVGT